MRPLLEKDGADFNGAPEVQAVIALMKERANTINELADAAMLFYRQPAPDAALLAQYLTEAAKLALADYAQRCQTVEWTKDALSAMLKEVLATHKLKMPQIAMPLRLLITGQLQTPSIDAVVALSARDAVVTRLTNYL